MQSKWLKVILVLLLLFAGIVFLSRGGKPLPTLYSSNGTTVFFPRRKASGLFGPRDLPTGELIGQLILVDGCLRIKSDKAYAPIWPPGYSLNFERGIIQILDVGGRGMAHVGDDIYVDGGETSVRDVLAIDEAMQQKILVNCEGPYWFVGDVVRRVN